MQYYTGRRKAPSPRLLSYVSESMKTLLRILLLLSFAAAVMVAVAWWVVARPLALSAPVDFEVERGFTMRQAARAAHAAGLPMSPDTLYWIARITGKAGRIVAGGYEVTPGMSALDVVDKLNRGDVTFAELRLIEGWNFRQVRAALESHEWIKPDTQGLDETALLQALGVPEAHPEGLFFPDTYRFPRYSTATSVLRTAHAAMQRHLADAWAVRDPEVPLASPYEALILASIIEKETGRPDERGLVASVFANRLRIGMRLQTDPTVIYGYGESFEGRLRRRHLDTDHDYNTYTRAGLPPTPIAMPGLASLQAAVRPDKSEYFYFVARGDGSSQFSRTLAEHNRAVNIHIRGIPQ